MNYWRKLMIFLLLRHRVFEINKKYCDTNKVLNNLISHQKRVEWQLHRIYRTRNAIVRSGTTPIYTQFLVSNAHDYFDQVFSLTMKFASRPNITDNYSDGFQYANLLYNQYCSDLNELDKLDSSTAHLAIWRYKTIATK